MAKKQEYWFPWEPLTFRRATAHLTTFQRGIYRELIDYYMETKEPLMNNDLALANIARVTVEEFAPHAEIIKAFFNEIKDGKARAFLQHSKCEAVLADQAERSKIKSENGKKGGRGKAKKIKGEKATGKLNESTYTGTVTEEEKEKFYKKKNQEGTENGKRTRADEAAAYAKAGLDRVVKPLTGSG